MATNPIDAAERLGRTRAAAFYFFAAMIAVTLVFSFGPNGADFFQGLWLGITFAAALNLAPIKRWLRPNSLVARLLDDESVREHRRLGCSAGFWAAVASALAMALVTKSGLGVSAFDAVRVTASATVIAALVCFATLELRAARG